MKAILAVDANMGIGVGNKLAFYNKEDLKWFKNYTLGKVCWAGYNTFNNLPPLVGREVAEFAPYMRAMMKNSPQYYTEHVIIGGAKTYKTLADLTDTCYITFFNKANPECDIFLDVYEVYKHLDKRMVTFKNKDFRIEKWSK